MRYSVKYFLKKYSHAWVLLYFLIYMPWFAWLEKNVTTEFSVIHIDLDDKIPFLEIFAVPYFLWFAYILSLSPISSLKTAVSFITAQPTFLSV